MVLNVLYKVLGIIGLGYIKVSFRIPQLVILQLRSLEPLATRNIRLSVIALHGKELYSWFYM